MNRNTKRITTLAMVTALFVPTVTNASPWPISPVIRGGHIRAGEKQFCVVTCQGLNRATVVPHFPNLNVDLDIFIYDSLGRLVACDLRPAPGATVQWFGTGNYRVVVWCSSLGHCNYTLRVD